MMPALEPLGFGSVSAKEAQPLGGIADERFSRGLYRTPQYEE